MAFLLSSFICVLNSFQPSMFSFCNVCYLQELVKREQEGQLDEGFLSEVNAQLRQVSLIPLNFVTFIFSFPLTNIINHELSSYNVNHMVSCD